MLIRFIAIRLSVELKLYHRILLKCYSGSTPTPGYMLISVSLIIAVGVCD